jgi:mannose-6-phosphate isomerase-like protein (cupin superfamily)
MSSHTPGAGDVVLMFDNVVTLAVSAADVEDAYCVVDVNVPANAMSPPLHTHPPAECFYTLYGRITVYRERADGSLEEIELPAGRAAYVPGGVRHTFANRGPGAARVLAICEGAMMERYFRAAGFHVEDGNALPALDPEWLAEAGARARAVGAELGFEFLGPVPVAEGARS